LSWAFPENYNKGEIKKMKKVWKWIIGIVLGLVVIAILLGVGFTLRSNFHGYRLEALNQRNFSERGPWMMPYGGFGHMRGPGMMGFRMMPFGGFIGGLLCLGFLTLVVFGIIWLVRNLRKPVPVEAAVVAPVAEVNLCKKCGKPLQDEWQNCPYCGKKV
jgi:hypothetical protein